MRSGRDPRDIQVSDTRGQERQPGSGDTSTPRVKGDAQGQARHPGTREKAGDQRDAQGQERYPGARETCKDRTDTYGQWRQPWTRQTTSYHGQEKLPGTRETPWENLCPDRPGPTPKVQYLYFMANRPQAGLGPDPMRPGPTCLTTMYRNPGSVCTGLLVSILQPAPGTPGDTARQY